MSHHTVSIVGSGHTKFGRLDSHSFEDLVVSAGREAIEDAGIDPAEIDATFLGHFNSGLIPDGFGSSLTHQISPAMRFKPATRCENACASGSAAIFAGIAAIESGQADVVLVVGAEKMTSKSTAEVTRALAGGGYQHKPDEAAMTFPQVFARAAQDYTSRYRDPRKTMAQIAVKNHGNAMRNPLAQLHRELSVEACNEVSEKNPLIAAPLRLTDCSLVSDGAAAIVLVSAARAEEFPREVAFRSRCHVSDFLPLSNRDLVAFEGAQRAIRTTFAKGAVELDDISFAEVHDCFTIAELLIYEAMGLCESGRGHDAIESGAVFRGGRLPVNLSGGLKAKGHPIGASGVSMHAIAYRQLTQRAGDMQLDDAELALVFNMGGACVANYASLLEIKRA